MGPKPVSPLRRRLALALRLCALLAMVIAPVGCATAEKHIREDVPRLYSADDPQFPRTMGALLGPAIVGGN